MSRHPKVVLITGVQAAGKSTLAPLLADRLGPPSMALEGDVFYSAVRAGHARMAPDPDPEAVRQLRLRYEASALVANHYAAAGFDVVIADVVLGQEVTAWMERITSAERHLVVLNPGPEVVVARERGRGGNSYRDWDHGSGSAADGVRTLQEFLEQGPRRGLWLDTSALDPSQSIEAILADGMAGSRY